MHPCLIKFSVVSTDTYTTTHTSYIQRLHTCRDYIHTETAYMSRSHTCRDCKHIDLKTEYLSRLHTCRDYIHVKLHTCGLWTQLFS